MPYPVTSWDSFCVANCQEKATWRPRGGDWSLLPLTIWLSWRLREGKCGAGAPRSSFFSPFHFPLPLAGNRMKGQGQECEVTQGPGLAQFSTLGQGVRGKCLYPACGHLWVPEPRFSTLERTPVFRQFGNGCPRNDSQ